MVKINIDFDAFFDLANLGDKVKVATKELTDELSMATVSFVLQKAEEKLNSSKELFLSSLSIEDADDGVGYQLKLDEKASWIEDGLKPTDMLPFLLKSPHAKISKDGSKYITVPMNLNTPLSASSSRQSLVSAIKSKTSTNHSASFDEIFGKKGAHKLHVATPLKTPGAFGGIGQGSGEVGKPMQGQTGVPFLQGLQFKPPGKDKEGKEKKSFVGTFRVASSKQEGKGMWQHPGTEPKHIFKEAQEFMAQELVKKIRGS